MAGEYAVDTNVPTAFLGGDRDVLKEMARAKKVWLPIPVLGELIYGALKSTNKEANLKEISKVLLLAGIIECDEKVADRYGRIRLDLKKKGRPIPENDIWIAACAEVKKVPLVTRDSHFNEIDSLEKVRW